MAEDAESSPAGPDDQALALRLLLHAGDPLSGTVRAEGREETAFAGWIELMAAINAARGAEEGGARRY